MSIRTIFYSIILSFVLPSAILAQKNAILEGYVYKENTKEGLPNARVIVQGTSYHVTADSSGYFNLTIPPGLYNVEASSLGFQPVVQYEIRPVTAVPVVINFFLEEKSHTLETVEVTAEAFRSTSESPASLQRINTYEIERMPGATLDLSKFLKTLPGVSPRVSFGYNMIVRGGASLENKFYLDDIEIPAITHFSVQGTSGGPNGLINTHLLREANFYKGAFPANRPNALSSILELHQREGRRDRFGANFTLGATDYGFVFEGPIGKKTSFLLSARESYAQHMFKVIGLPILPFYSDVQYHQVLHLGKSEITLVGLGAYDKFLLNLGAKNTESFLYNTGYIPEGKQLLYTGGIRYKYYSENGYYTVVASRNWLRNTAQKFRGNTYLPEDKTLDYTSEEGENKFRLEHKLFFGDTQWEYGIDLEQDKTLTDNYSLYVSPAGVVDTVQYNSNLDFVRYGAFISYGNTFADGEFDVFTGLRVDGNTYNEKMRNPLSQLSPRAALNWHFRKGWRTGLSTGIYNQLPPYVLLSYESDDQLVNRENMRYIRSIQVAALLERTTEQGYQVLLEGFYKHYDHYPFLLNDSISLANANANYVLVGNQPASSGAKGQAYGLEFLVRQKLRKTYFWSISYSYTVSRFEGRDGQLAPSAWDNRHVAVIAAGKTFKRNWQLGFRWTLAGGSPYTPYDIALSSRRNIWDVTQRGLFDYSRLNTERLPVFHQLDVRVDKQFNYRNWTLSLYMDIANAYRSPISNLPYLTVERDETGQPVVDPSDSGSYLTKIISSDTGRILPTVGIIADF